MVGVLIEKEVVVLEGGWMSNLTELLRQKQIPTIRQTKEHIVNQHFSETTGEINIESNDFREDHKGT